MYKKCEFGCKSDQIWVIFVAARQKEMATSSVTELVQAVKRPRSLSESRPRALSESMNRRLFRKSGGGGGGGDNDGDRFETGMVRRKSESAAASTGRGSRRSMQRINEVPDKKPKKSSRRSFMGYGFFFFPSFFSA